MRTRTALLLFLVLAGVLLVGYGLGRVANRPEVRVDSTPVVDAIRKVAKLATVEIEVADIVRFEEVRRIVVFDVPKNAVLKLRGRVLGGFDLNTGFTVKVDDASRTIRVELPAPGILSVDTNVSWFSEESGFLNPITPDDRTRWTAWGRARLARAAREAGLAAKATAHARELLESAGAALGWTVIVNVSTGGLGPVG